MLFWKNKNRNKISIEKEIPMVKVKKIEDHWGYVEIFSLSQRLLRLNQLVHFIEEIHMTDKVSQAELMSYQTNLKEAYITEFEQEYKKVFFKPMHYEDFKRTRSTL